RTVFNIGHLNIELKSSICLGEHSLALQNDADSHLCNSICPLIHIGVNGVVPRNLTEVAESTKVMLEISLFVATAFCLGELA
ncbi:MAG: hypothetical protein AAGB19_06530, partial [Cyanobacteria bacterium P01_F01_bin.3]